MRAVVVFESLLGNTREVAESIADGIRDAHPGAGVACGTAAELGAEAAAADLLVVGTPTHSSACLRRATSGAATRRIARRLRRAGYQLVIPPEGFFVDDMTGPLGRGELERARTRGATGATLAARRAASRTVEHARRAVPSGR